MKPLFVLAAGMAAAIALIACSPAAQSVTIPAEAMRSWSGKVLLWVDPETHCHYLIAYSDVNGGVSITPRLWSGTNGMCFNADQ